MTRPTDQDFRSAIEAHGKRVERYRSGELDQVEFPPIRLGYGLVLPARSHQPHAAHQAAGRLADRGAGRLLADIADDYARGVLHVTTRQDVQLHWIDLENVIEIYERLHAVGITTRGACADSVRNVTGCIHAGTLAGRAVRRDAVRRGAVHEYFLFHPLNLTLPRKFKIAFASCADDCVQAPRQRHRLLPASRDGGRNGFASSPAAASARSRSWPCRSAISSPPKIC